MARKKKELVCEDFQVVENYDLAKVKQRCKILEGLGYRKEGGLLADCECKGTHYIQGMIKEVYK